MISTNPRAKALGLLRKIVGELRCRIFDLRHNVRTQAPATLESLTIRGPNAAHGVFYFSSHPKYLSETFRGLAIDYRRYTLIDIGSGKGRVLLVASEFPFREAIGVEFSRELHEIASRNISQYRSSTQKCRNVHSIHADAVDFSFPDSPMVIYMFNPFRPPVLEPVLANLRRSVEEHPRPVLIVYGAPFHSQVIERHDWLKLEKRTEYHNLYVGRDNECCL